MSMVKKYNYLFLCTYILVWITGCKESPGEKYEQLEEKELASGIRYDSLFKGLYFTMKEKEFMDYCFSKNLQGQFRQGGVRNGAWVECKLSNELKYPAAINFFPTFKHHVITGMEASVYYDHASFKDKVFHCDTLLFDVLHLMEQWYGPGFIKIKGPYFYEDDVFVKVNGNRRITVYKDRSNQMINVWFVDLLAENEKHEKD